ncbi:MAG: precorrin-6y C5,15-methyltransferase (decarboxylating) subunit CbiE [Hyphomicrobiales bacterium]|nr:precorrin-6y C5,15-methyltransferase (decarboxylating) subunit CbiE [Hyphomicrobiales bacterium]
MSAPWLSIIGLGEDGLDGLSPAATHLLRQASLVVGGKRHLELVGRLDAETLAWPSPIEEAYPIILARRGQQVCVLASGDPFFYGVGSALARLVDMSEIVSLPSPSAFSLMASRLGWPQQDCALVSLHGRPLERIIPCLSEGARILALSWDETTPAKLASLLTERGLGRSRLTVGEHLGGAKERVRAAFAEAFDLDAISPLNAIALEVAAAPGARLIPRAPGLPDDWFENDGQLTKSEIRAVTLSALAPRRGEALWDIGAGSGSIAIEWLLADPANRAFAIEKNADRAARVMRNAAALGTPGLRLIEGAAPEALIGLPTPDAIFIGGGASAPGVLDAALAALRPHGRLVVNAVTIETQAELSRRFSALGGDLVQLSVARAEKVGGFHGFRPAMPIVQWRYEKP